MKNKFLCWLLGMLGFSAMSSCDKIIDGGKEEYGTPHADFSVSGKVADTDGKPIQGIRVVLTNPEGHQSAADTTYTAADGKYMLDYPGIFPFRDTTLIIEAEDVDGEENGEYKKQVTDFTPAPFSGRNGWYHGESRNTVDFQLTAGGDDEQGGDGGSENKPE